MTTGKMKISEYRNRLDNTLASSELKDKEILKDRIKNQVLQSSLHGNNGYSDNALEKRTTEVANFLDMLRSATNDDKSAKTREAAQSEWKLKQENEDFRVMYREGPQGTPFHNLLVEGYIDGPLDVCLCVSWESSLYRKWWPQYSFPPFKITSSERVQKVGIGEQVSLVRVKVPWPLSARESLIHYFLFEYFEDDLIVILLNTISDVKSIDINTHGFSKDGIPEAKDVVRMDVVGGFALQKVTTERSYFRTIGNLDMKLDFVPPALINFISRQLTGNGFRLYQKAVASVSNHDEEYNKALNDPMYTRIRESLNSAKESRGALEGKEPKEEAHVQDNDQFVKETLNETANVQQEGKVDEHVDEPSLDISQGIKRTFGEIEEEETEESTFLEVEMKKEENEVTSYVEKDSQAADKTPVNVKRNIRIRPEVQQALGTLEKAISIVREHRPNGQSNIIPSIFPGKTSGSEKSVLKDLLSTEDDGACSKAEVCTETSKVGVEARTSHDSRNSILTNEKRSNSVPREVNHSRKGSGSGSSPQQDVTTPQDTNQNRTTDSNGIHQNGESGVKMKGSLLRGYACCFSPSSRFA